MNKILFYIIEFILDFIIVGLIPVLIAFGMPIEMAAFYSVISFITLHIRQWFVEKYKN
jgi:hypothetical protein